MCERLDARHNGVENAFQLDRLQQQLINLRESFECAELLIEADDAAVECLDELPRRPRYAAVSTAPVRETASTAARISQAWLAAKTANMSTGSAVQTQSAKPMRRSIRPSRGTPPMQWLFRANVIRSIYSIAAIDPEHCVNDRQIAPSKSCAET